MAESHGIPTSVYRYYDGQGLLLYVGITSRSIRRNDEHTIKEWWHYVATQDIEQYPDRRSAEAREKSLIQRFRPPFNVQHNAEHGAIRSAYHELAGGAQGDPKKHIDLYPTRARTGTGVWLASDIDDAPTVRALDTSLDRAQLPGRAGKVRHVQRIGNVIAVEVDSRNVIEKAVLTTRRESSRPLKLSIKAVTLTVI